MVTKKHLELRLGDTALCLLGNISRVQLDMDILSKRITNAFEYITTVMAAHELEFHPKAVPKKGKK